MQINRDKYFGKIYREEKSQYLLPLEDEDDNLVQLVCKIPLFKNIKQINPITTLQIGETPKDAERF